MKKFFKRPLPFLLAVCFCLFLLLCLFRPIKHIDIDSVNSIDIIYWNQTAENIAREDKEKIINTLNDIPFYFPDIRPWRSSLGGSTVDQHIVIHFTTGRTVDIRFLSGVGPLVTWNGDSGGYWLIGYCHQQALEQNHAPLSCGTMYYIPKRKSPPSVGTSF